MITDYNPDLAFGCPDDQYDLNTLRPVNDRSALRLAGLSWTREDFEGHSVLDVGCNITGWCFAVHGALYKVSH